MKRVVMILGLVGVLMIAGCGAPTEDEVAAVKDVKAVENKSISIYREGNTIFSTATFDSGFKYANRAVEVYGYRVTEKNKSRGYIKAVPAKTKPLGSAGQPVLEVVLSDLRNDGVKVKVKVSVDGKYDKRMSEMTAKRMVDRFIEILNDIAAQNRK